MGAVINDSVPKIVCEVMSAGSLQSVVFNHTVILESPFIWPILNSIANALEYLHFSNTPIVHG
jgi:serine/threonine protein kinase